ncbi:MazG family protein [Cutibacterium sp. WCA-380-WT-3A]|uniref:MazG family protein n=1 Tax=Cutibacterium porci TaxID=2605781 RepID=A0A7K0J5L4_9ACTN|nr:MazG family protein [Cutibacterium porci]MSS45207.1 MazG family protein [Cutibacterium porci]
MAVEGDRPRANFSELVTVMARLRDECPWDRSQTHRSLVTYLVEETGEVIDAIEAGTDRDLVEELGDLLLQVVFHSRIGEEEGRFDIDEVVGGIVAKLVARHPYVFSDEEVPDDLDAAWEARKAAAKGRTSSLDGIARSLSSVVRATKVISRARSRGVDVALPDEAMTAEGVGEHMLALIARAQASGVDPDQALRDRLRRLEDEIRDAERRRS